MTQEWVTVFAGSFSRAMALQASLEARGIPTYIPDEMTKTMDPFITGANPLGVELRVPVEDRAEVEEMLATVPPAETRELSEAERDDERIASLAQRIRWCFVFPFLGWLIGAWLGARYLSLTRGRSERPPGHRVTIALWCAEILLSVAAMFGVVAAPTLF